jgi:hypothetical protein
MPRLSQQLFDELVELLDDNLTAWQGEEDSVKEEHSELIERLEAFDLSTVFTREDDDNADSSMDGE